MKNESNPFAANVATGNLLVAMNGLDEAVPNHAPRFLQMLQ